MRLYLSILSLLFIFISSTAAADDLYKFWVQFSDKTGTPYTLDNPREFLSQRAIERRQRYGIPLDWQDLPVNPTYIDNLKSENIRVLYTSKWMNSAVIETHDSSIVAELLLHPFVSYAEMLFAPPCPVKSGREKSETIRRTTETGIISDHQIEMLQGHLLHAMGYRGDNMVIALLDTGFGGTDTLPGFDSLYVNNKILGSRNFVEPGKDAFSLGEHGTNVLSILGGNLPGRFLGAAPSASYWLIQTEDVRSEQHIEEANWLAGAEFADSAGADIIQSSLGYSDGFTCPSIDYTYRHLDGNTTLVTRAADMAASRGMLIVTSAGNSGNDPWQFINSPGDGDSVLAVGAIDADGDLAEFSSRGPTFDGRTKPDVVAQGVSTAVLRAWGDVALGNGTSFAAPIIAGLAACLWQMHPEVNNYELMEAIRKSSHLYPYPNQQQGYGKPDFMYASEIISNISAPAEPGMYLQVFPNPVRDDLYLYIVTAITGTFTYRIVDMSGRNMQSGKLPLRAGSAVISMEHIGAGTYMIILEGDAEVYKTLFTRE